MKTFLVTAVLMFIFISGTGGHGQQQKYILEHEKDIAVNEPGPHNGGGSSTGYSFFSNARDFKTVFRKRVLHKGSAIGYHPQNEDEVYYVVSGKGEMVMNGETFKVSAGDAVLTRPGSSHGLKQMGDSDLSLIIVYQNH